MSAGLFRWAGSKRRVLPQLMQHLAAHRPGCGIKHCTPLVASCGCFRRRWIEPFVGSAAVALEAMRQGLAAEFILGDALSEIASTLRTIRDCELTLRGLLQVWVAMGEDSQRSAWPDLVATRCDNDFDRALRFLRLQSASFNGLWRVNKNGRYNVPWGRRASVDFDCIEEAATLLRRQGVSVVCQDFSKTIALAEFGDLVYCDPPYVGAHSTYGPGGFSIAEHVRLGEAMRDATRRGAEVWASGSDCAATVAAYCCGRDESVVHRIAARRSISCKAATRGEKAELLIKI